MYASVHLTPTTQTRSRAPQLATRLADGLARIATNLILYPRLRARAGVGANHRQRRNTHQSYVRRRVRRVADVHTRMPEFTAVWIQHIERTPTLKSMSAGLGITEYAYACICSTHVSTTRPRFSSTHTGTRVMLGYASLEFQLQTCECNREPHMVYARQRELHSVLAHTRSLLARNKAAARAQTTDTQLGALHI